MRSRVIKTIVAAAMLASLALGAGEAWGSDVTGPPPIVQSIRVPVMNYGEPDGGSSNIRGIARTLTVYGLSLWTPLPLLDVWHTSSKSFRASPSRPKTLGDGGKFSRRMFK